MLNDLCSSFDKDYGEQLAASISEGVHDLQSSYESIKVLVADDASLSSDLDSEYNSNKRLVEISDSISGVFSKVSGFEHKAKLIVARKRTSDPDTDPGGSSTPVKPSVTVKLLIPPSSISTDEDIESLVQSVRSKLKDKLKDGPFDINW